MENAKLRNFAMGIGIRETRRIVGEYALTIKDIFEEHKFDDSIGVYPFCMDGPEGTIPASTGRHFQTPFRITIPTGVASALSISDEVNSRHVNIPALQKELARQGVRIR